MLHGRAARLNTLVYTPQAAQKATYQLEPFSWQRSQRRWTFCIKLKSIKSLPPPFLTTSRVSSLALNDISFTSWELSWNDEISWLFFSSLFSRAQFLLWCYRKKMSLLRDIVERSAEILRNYTPNELQKMNESSDFNFLISSKLFGVNEFTALLARRLGYDDSRQAKWIRIQQQLDSDERVVRTELSC